MVVDIYLSIYVSIRAGNEPSRSFHNSGEDPYYRAFSWLKAPASACL